MIEPKVSDDGRCPSCASDDWKLAKVIVSSGTTIIETESEGGGWGVSAGRGGVGVNYQGMNLDTKGTLKTADVDKYAAPQMPDSYNDKLSILHDCQKQISEARSGITKVDAFALNRESIKPGFFDSFKDSNFVEWRSTYDKNVAILETFRRYEISRALWEKMRVCNRCGEGYVTTEDKQASARKITIPEYTFDGVNRKCPYCNSYVWKAANAFFEIKLLELQNKCDVAKTNHSKAVECANKSSSGFWVKVQKFITIKPEDAQKEVDFTELQLTEMRQRQKEAIEQYPHHDYEKVRVCINCENLYLLDE